MQKYFLRIVVLSVIVGLFVIGCGSKKSAVLIANEEKAIYDQPGQDTVNIASDETEYEILIIEPGFNFWLQSYARPVGYHSQTFLESRNEIFIVNWNQRAMQPQSYDPSLYELRIDYDRSIDYGYEVNYKLYNYFIYFQRKYKQRLGPFLPRI